MRAFVSNSFMSIETETLFCLGRVRGLVNFRTMPSSLSPSERNKFLASALRSTYFGYGQRGGDADNIMQMDNDQGATMF